MPRHLTVDDIAAGGLIDFVAVNAHFATLDAFAAGLTTISDVAFGSVSTKTFNVLNEAGNIMAQLADEALGRTAIAGVRLAIPAIQFGPTFGAWGAGSDVDALLAGTTSGAIIESTLNAHLVIGIRDNDINDSFAIVSGSGNWATDSTYDKLLFQVRADGVTTLSGPLTFGGGASVSKIDRGIYLPVTTNTTNIDTSTPFNITGWHQIGDMVTVAGAVNVDPTALGACVMGFSLPVASDIQNVVQLGGAGAFLGGVGVRIVGDVANDRATFEWTAAVTTNTTMSFQFSYRII